MKRKKGSNNYLVRVNGTKYETTSIRRFSTHVGTINWENPTIEVYLRVSYGRHEDVNGKQQDFYNDAVLYNKKDFNRCLEAFLDV